MLVIIAVAGASIAWAQNKPMPAASPTGFAIVELFTSEGCSSCPSADAALADLAADAKGKHVYALAFHVDYWDGLGWTDAFADKSYTARQYGYATAKHLDGVYTPQVVVNGGREFNGSDRESLKTAVGDALAAAANGSISAAAKKVDDGVQLDLTTASLPEGTVLNAALTENGLTSKVTLGENRGKVLPHEHVVRAFRSAAIDAKGNASVTLGIPGDVHRDQATIIVYAQRATDLAVIAAAEVALPQ